MIKCLENCLPCCLQKKSASLNINEQEKQIHITNGFTNLVNSVISLGSYKNKIILDNICKICNKELSNKNESCDCLTKDELHPNFKQTELKIREKYIHNRNIINEAIHIDKNPDKLVLLVNDIYDIVEKSTLNEDLTPKRLEKVKENLINEICVHIEDYIKNEE